MTKEKQISYTLSHDKTTFPNDSITLKKHNSFNFGNLKSDKNPCKHFWSIKDLCGFINYLWYFYWIFLGKIIDKNDPNGTENPLNLSPMANSSSAFLLSTGQFTIVIFYIATEANCT